MKQREPRSDSSAAAIQAAQNAAQGPLNPPAHTPLPAEAMPFWRALMACRPRHKWTDADLGNAAILAMTQLQVQALICDIENAALVDKLSRRIIGLSRMLHVVPDATSGRMADQPKKLALEHEAASNVHHLIRQA